MPRFEVPDELAFLEAFGVEPTHSAPAEGFWCYRFEDEARCALSLSFNILERSVQTVQETEGRVTSTVSSEGGLSLRIVGDTLEGECHVGEARTRVLITVAPRIEVSWATLLV